MQAPVTDILKDYSFFLDLDNTVFIKLGDNRREILFGTIDNTLRLVRNMQEVANAVEGTKFMKIEQGMVLNMERVNNFDPEKNLIHFEPAGLEGIDHWHVSRENITRVKRFLH